MLTLLLLTLGPLAAYPGAHSTLPRVPAATGLAALDSGGEVRLAWRGGRHPLDDLPAELPEPALEVLDWVGPFADEHGLELHLDPAARVLYVADDPSERSLDLIERTLDWFDRVLPPPKDRAGGAAPGTVPGGGAGAKVARAGGARDGFEPIPDDPGGGKGVSLEEALGGGPPKPTTRWGAGAGALDRDTAVLLRVDPEQYAAFVDLLVRQAPELATWGQGARTSAGFALELPLSGAYVMDVVYQEEFDPDAELVHRLVDLMLLRRFGRQPYWVVRGVCWSAEWSLRKAIWCYPYRDEFVYTVEHAGWPADVRRRVKKNFKDDPLSLEHVAALSRGKWSGEPARLAFATAHWLLDERREAMSALLEDLRLAYDRGSRLDTGAGTWERDVGYEVPVAEQETLMLEHLGEDVFQELTAGLRGFR